MIRKNARNVVIVKGPLVVKFPRDGKIGRIFREFALTWKAFLHGLAPPTVLLGPFLLQARVDLPLKVKDPKKKLELAKKVIPAIERLAEIGIEHRELRHPENHVGLWRGRIVFIDFDHARLSKKSRDLNKFRAWMEGVMKALGERDKYQKDL